MPCGLAQISRTTSPNPAGPRPNPTHDLDQIDHNLVQIPHGLPRACGWGWPLGETFLEGPPQHQEGAPGWMTQMTHPRGSRACRLRPSYMSHGCHDSAANSKESATTRDSRRKDGSWRCQEPWGTLHGPGRLPSPKEEGTSERWRWPRVTQPTWGKEAHSLRCQPSATPRLEGGRSGGGGRPGLQPPTCLHLHSQCPLAPGLPTAQPGPSTRELQSSVLGQTLEAARTGPHHGLSPATTWTLDTQSRLASPPGPSSDRNEASLLLTTEGEVGGSTSRGCTLGAGTNPGPSVTMESGGPGGRLWPSPLRPPASSQPELSISY